MKTKVLFYTSEPVSGVGFSSVLRRSSDLELIGICPQADNLIEMTQSKAPDVLLLELTAGITFQILRELQKQFRPCKVLLWVGEISTELAFQAMGLGVRGIVRKTMGIEELTDCLRRVNLGELWFEKSLTDKMLKARKVSLTRREGQLVTLLSQGLKNKELAFILNISENTVKVYLSRLFAKIGVKDRFELALYGLRNVAAGEGRLDKPVNKKEGSQEVAGLRSIVIDGLTKAA